MTEGILPIVVTGFALLTIISLYILPTSIAARRELACGTFLVFAVNILIGWTVIGWLVCLLWAALGQTKAQAAFYAHALAAAQPMPAP